MEKNIANNIINLALFIVGVALFIAAQGIRTGAAMGQGGDFMPKLCSTVWLGLSGIMLVLGFCGGKKTSVKACQTKTNIKGLLMTLALLFVYILLLNSVGFMIMSVIYLFLQILLFTPKEQRTKKTYIIIAVLSLVIPITVDILFANVFSLIMPAGLLR